MGIVEEQFEVLKAKEKCVSATLSRNGDGSYVVTIPNYPLPPGWNRSQTTIYFIVPVGYPMAQPDCFWSDPGLFLLSGAVPQNIGNNAAPGLPNNLQWFSWHPQSWSPNSDSLRSYVGVIQKRFKELR